MPRRSETRARTIKSEPDDLYGLFIQGLPRNIGWQDLKDYIRQMCPNAKVKHADVKEEGDGINDGISHIIINGKESAGRAYVQLATHGYQGKSVTVALAKADHCYETNSYNFTTIAPPRTSPPQRGKTLYNPNKGGRTPPLASITPIRTMGPGYTPLSVPPQASYTGIPYDGAATQLRSPIEAQTPGYPLSPTGFVSTGHSQQYPPVSLGQPSRYPAHRSSVSNPSYQNSSPPSNYRTPSATNQHGASSGLNGMTTSASSSTMRSVPVAPSGPSGPRTIFIQNLAPQVSWQLLKDRLRKIGEVTRCDVKMEAAGSSSSSKSRDSDKRQPKQYAIATFLDAGSAERAVRMLDGVELGGRRMRVRVDDSRGSTPSSQSRTSGKRSKQTGSSYSKGSASTSGSAAGKFNERSSNGSRGTTAVARSSKTHDSKSTKKEDKKKGSGATSSTGVSKGPLVVDGNKAKQRYPSSEEEEDDDDDDDDDDESDSDSEAEESADDSDSDSEESEDDESDEMKVPTRRLRAVRLR